MDLSSCIPVLTDATLPLLGARQAAVYLAACGVLGGIIAMLAHLARSDGGGDSWRRLRFLGLVLLPLGLWRGLCWGSSGGSMPVLVAAVSLLDVALLALAVSACLTLLRGRGRRRCKLVLFSPMLAAVFLGLLGGDLERTLLGRNLPAAMAHLLSLSLLAVVLVRELVLGLRRGRNLAEARVMALEAERVTTVAAAADARSERDQAVSKASEGLDLARDAGRRARLLEHLMAGAVDLQARRDQQDLQQYAVEMVSVLFGFGRVVLHQWSASLEAFVVQAADGYDEHERDQLAASHTPRGDYDQLVHPRFRISDSFLVPPPSASWPPAMPADEAAWPEGQRLIVPLTDPAGAVHGFLEMRRPEAGHAPDLLRIRYLELLARQLAALHEVLDMRERLAGSRGELALANERLQSLGDLRSNFVANVSHELRTPLTSIIGYAEMLRDRGEEMSPQIRHEFLDVIHEQGLQFKEIINDLLDLDRMEDGTTRVERVECDLAALARRLAEDWRQQAEAGGQNIEVKIGAGTVTVEADPVLSQQLLSHLVDNALKFTPKGGCITVRLAEQGTAVRLEVEDTGIGIPEEQLHTIFEQFYQVDSSATREVGGQGVGLAICQDIVSWHDGRIWAENIPGGGARMTVLLPRRPHVVIPEPPQPINPVFHEPKLFIQRLIHWVGENLGVHSAVLLVADNQRQHLEILAATGVPAGQLQDLRLARGVGLVGRTWDEGVSLMENPPPGDVLLVGETPVLCVPLVDEGTTIGVVAVRDRVDGRPLSDDNRILLEAMAPRLVQLLSRYQGHTDLIRDFAAVQSSLRVTTRVGTLPHTDVAGVCEEICFATARRLALPEEEQRHLAFALQHYDVGLGGVPPYVLNKVEALTEAERHQLERHVQAGLVTLAPLHPSPKVRQIILHHHENYDGSGYPKGLAGEAIPLGSRLIALTDSLRALLQQRPWRPAVRLSDALAEIQALAGTRYCPRLTAVFLEEAERRRVQIDELRQRADDGEDLKRPAPLHPVQLVRG